MKVFSSVFIMFIVINEYKILIKRLCKLINYQLIVLENKYYEPFTNFDK